MLGFGNVIQLSFQEFTIEPTKSMVSFFEQRTKAHIERVRRCLLLLAKQSEFGDELRERAKVHDVSKLDDAERIPYIWLTEYHRCLRNNEPFEYPNGIEELVRAAIRHHVTTNRHHPEFHSDPNEMTDVDIVEMVCDWTAMAQEFGENSGSAKSWADKTIGNQVVFNQDRRKLVYQTIEELDAELARESAG